MPTVRSFLCSLAALASTALAHSGSNVAIYWGQGYDQIPLSQVCSDPSVDIVNLGFVNRFPKKVGDYPGTNFGNACGSETYPSPSGGNSELLSHCPGIGPGIDICHANGKKVLLSIGGGYPLDYYLPSKNVAEYFAEFLWGAFGPATHEWKAAGKPRPFGDAYVDGFDLDLEAYMNPPPSADYMYANYRYFVSKLKNDLYPTASGNFYISGAPQCVVPDARLADAISKSSFDFIFTQFYNTPQCSVRAGYNGLGSSSTTFTFDNWVTWLKANSANKGVKLYMGMPASADGAPAEPSAYLTPSEANKLISYYATKHADIFGGVMLWEATLNSRNTICNKEYATHIKDILLGTYIDKVCPSASSTMPSSTPTITASSTTKTPAATPTAVSPNGLCGPSNGFGCTGSGFGDCCSEFGFCGSSPAYCGTGCNPLFGKCGVSTSSTLSSSTTPTSSSSSIKSTSSSSSIKSTSSSSSIKSTSSSTSSATPTSSSSSSATPTSSSSSSVRSTSSSASSTRSTSSSASSTRSTSSSASSTRSTSSSVSSATPTSYSSTSSTSSYSPTPSASSHSSTASASTRSSTSSTSSYGSTASTPSTSSAGSTSSSSSYSSTASTSSSTSSSVSTSSATSSASASSTSSSISASSKTSSASSSTTSSASSSTTSSASSSTSPNASSSTTSSASPTSSSASPTNSSASSSTSSSASSSTSSSASSTRMSASSTSSSASSSTSSSASSSASSTASIITSSSVLISTGSSSMLPSSTSAPNSTGNNATSTPSPTGTGSSISSSSTHPGTGSSSISSSSFVPSPTGSSSTSSSFPTVTKSTSPSLTSSIPASTAPPASTSPIASLSSSSVSAHINTTCSGTTSTATYPTSSPSSKKYTYGGPSATPVVTSIMTTTYLDICPTGLITRTATISKTACSSCTPGYPESTGIPEGWTTTVTVCKHCGPQTTTITLTRPKSTPATTQTLVVIPYLPESSSNAGPSGNPYKPAGFGEESRPSEAFTKPTAAAAPTTVVNKAPVPPTATAVPSTLMPSYNPVVPSVKGATPSGNGTTAYIPIGTATKSVPGPTYSTVKEFQGAAVGTQVGRTLLGVLVVGWLVL